MHEGPQGAVELVRAAGADVVLNAIVGAAGLEASLATLECGADLALANKESLVAGGPLVLEALRRSGRRLLPVDSEHSALQQCLGSEPRDALEGLVITASGGPFRGRTRAELAEVTVDDALAHPTWAMGAKITVDSATLMNKGLEVIEAHVLFDLPYDRIEVVVHPQSIVHGLARFRDGALLAHVGHPDMRVPISYALTYPERAATAAPRFDVDRAFSLDFEPPDTATFRCLALARAAGEAGGTSPCILNAANEEAVAAFLAGRVGFLDIDALVADALDRVPSGPVDDLDAVRAADGAATGRRRGAPEPGDALMNAVSRSRTARPVVSVSRPCAERGTSGALVHDGRFRSIEISTAGESGGSTAVMCCGAVIDGRAGGPEMSVGLVLLGLLFLILVHELGHFVVAKALGAKATKFYVGFPPPLIRRQHGETEYGIGAIPVGGYVRIVGMTRPQASDLWKVDDAVAEAAHRRPAEADDRFGAVGRRATRAAERRRPRPADTAATTALATLEEERELLDPRTAAEARKDLDAPGRGGRPACLLAPAGVEAHLHHRRRPGRRTCSRR